MGVVLTLPALTADEVAQAVRQALAVELARLDVAVSTRAAPDDVPSGGTTAPAPTYGGLLT